MHIKTRSAEKKKNSEHENEATWPAVRGRPYEGDVTFYAGTRFLGTGFARGDVVQICRGTGRLGVGEVREGGRGVLCI